MSPRKMLYCVVTRKEINNIPSHIENHVTGRKFQRDLKICKYRANFCYYPTLIGHEQLEWPKEQHLEASCSVHSFGTLHILLGA